MQKKYAYNGAIVKGLSAKEVAKQLLSIERKYGGALTSANILKEARNISHPLHSFFEWDDSVAAEKYRLVQATSLIRSLVIIEKDRAEKKQNEKVRLFYNIKRDEDKNYSKSTWSKDSSFVNINRVEQEQEIKDYTLQRARGEMESFIRRYANIKAHFGEFSEMLIAAAEVKEILKAI